MRPTLTKNDRAALAAAFEQYHNGEEFDLDKAKFASHCAQGRTLELRPWQIPPADIDDPNNPDAGRRPDFPGAASDGRREAAKLLQQMLAVGVSRWDPDPLAAIAAVERKQQTND